jgi:hypothetical protein
MNWRLLLQDPNFVLQEIEDLKVTCHIERIKLFFGFVFIGISALILYSLAVTPIAPNNPYWSLFALLFSLAFGLLMFGLNLMFSALTSNAAMNKRFQEGVNTKLEQLLQERISHSLPSPENESDQPHETAVENPPMTQQEYNSREIVANTMLEVAWKDYSSSSEDKRSLDNKSNMILVASGVLLGLLINGYKIMEPSYAFLAGGLLIGACVCCIVALGIRTYSSLGTMKTWDALKSLNILDKPLNAKLNIMATIDKAVDDNRTQTKNIARMIRYANLLFIAALIVVSLSVVLHFVITMETWHSLVLC